MSFTLFPYDGKGNIPDAVFHWFWHKMVEQEIADKVFYSGHIGDAYGFALLMKTTVVPSILIDDDTQKPIAMAWLSDIVDNRALGHFAILEDGREEKLALGKEMMRYWIETLGINTVLGIVPSFNKPAIRYMDELGMCILGEIPTLVKVGEEYESAFLGYFSREELEDGSAICDPPD